MALSYCSLPDPCQASHVPLEGIQRCHTPGGQTWQSRWPERCCSYKQASASHSHMLSANDGVLLKERTRDCLILCHRKTVGNVLSRGLCVCSNQADTCSKPGCTCWFQGRDHVQTLDSTLESGMPSDPGTQTPLSTHIQTQASSGLHLEKSVQFYIKNYSTFLSFYTCTAMVDEHSVFSSVTFVIAFGHKC